MIEGNNLRRKIQIIQPVTRCRDEIHNQSIQIRQNKLQRCSAQVYKKDINHFPPAYNFFYIVSRNVHCDHKLHFEVHNYPSLQLTSS